MHPAIAAERELLLATAQRYEADLSSEALFGILIAAGELVAPRTLPAPAGTSDGPAAGPIEDPAGVVRAVRARLQHHAATAGSVAEQFACARAARELAAVELDLNAPARPAAWPEQPSR